LVKIKEEEEKKEEEAHCQQKTTARLVKNLIVSESKAVEVLYSIV